MSPRKETPSLEDSIAQLAENMAKLQTQFAKDRAELAATISSAVTTALNNRPSTSYKPQNFQSQFRDMSYPNYSAGHNPTPFAPPAPNPQSQPGGSVGRDDRTSCVNSMFQTRSGKAINICSTGLIKARTLLGLEENSDRHETSRGLGQSRKHANVGEFLTSPSSVNLQTKSAGTNLRFQDTRYVPVSKFKFQTGVYGGEIKEVTRGSVCSAYRPPSIKFHTTGGRSVKVSGDALKRARSLLGDPDLGNFLEEGDAGSPVILSNKNSSFGDDMLNKENNVRTFFSNDTPKAKQMSKSFISPVRSTLSDRRTAVSFGYAVPPSATMAEQQFLRHFRRHLGGPG